MNRLSALVPILALSASCSRGDQGAAPRGASATPTPTAATAATAAPSAASPGATSTTAAPPPRAGPAVISPPIPPLERGMMDHVPPQAGWSKDGSSLGYCAQIAVTFLCSLIRPDGKADAFQTDTEAHPEAERKARDRAARLGFHSTSPGVWAYAGELELTWKSNTGGCDKTPKVKEVIEVGARVPGEPGSYPIKLAMTLEKDGVCFGSAHPEIIAISPDGAYVGAIGHGFAGEWANDWPMGIATVAAVAEGAFNNAGLAHHKKGDYKRAAELFEKASRADPSSKAAAFNLACAYARQGDARAEAALEEAIARGGDEAKNKAQKDADFDGVRSKAWFTALVK